MRRRKNVPTEASVFIAAVACAVVAAVAYASGPMSLSQEGAFTCDLVLDARELPLDVAGLLERDRMLMSGSSFAPGMKHKIIPFTYPAPDPGFPGTMIVHSGGRYLFDTRNQAATYGNFVKNVYTVDGTPFLDQAVFLAADCHDWDVVAAVEFVDDYEHRSLRTERWVVSGDVATALEAAWPSVETEAERRGYAGVWLLQNAGESLVTLVSFDEGLDLIFDRYVRVPLGDLVAQPGWTKTLDRDQYVFTNWQPFVPGDQGVPSAWPNFPLIPFEPGCGDGVCEPSRGETHASCPEECAPGCGNAVCDPDEDDHACPGDCQLF